MSFRNYVSAGRDIVRELQAIFSKEDIETIDRYLEKEGEGAWDEWQKAHEEDVAKFLRATPSRRKQTKKWNKEEMRPYLIFAALVQARKGLQLMESALELESVEGMSYRDALAEAADIVDQIFY